MRAILVGAFVVALCACKKEEPKKFSIQIDASCRTCIVHYYVGLHTTGYDTIYGVIEGGDTLIGTGRWNVVAEEGEGVSASLHSIEFLDFSTMTISFSGDVPDMSTSAASPDWAILNYAPH